MNVDRVLRGLRVVATSMCAFVWVSHGAAQAAIYVSCPPSPTSRIVVNSFQWGAGSGASSTGGGAPSVSQITITTPAPTPAPKPTGITIVREVDKASPLLWSALTGSAQQMIGPCEIDFDPGSQPKGFTYLTLTLSNVTPAVTGGSPTQTVVLTFAKIAYSRSTEVRKGDTFNGASQLHLNLTPTPTPSPKK
jgi:type VI protein secretion system component Hcp